MTAVCIRGGGAARSPEQAAARDSSSDEKLIRRIAEGDQLAMRTLFARHRVTLYRWMLRLVGDEALAEDLSSCVVRGAFVSLDVAAGNRAPQGALSPAPSD